MIKVKEVKLAVAAMLSSIVMTSCSKVDLADWVKNPQKAVGKSFAIKANRTVLASTSADNIWTLEKGFLDKAQANVREHVAKEGRIMGAIDTIANIKTFAKEANKGINIADLGIANINVDAQHKRNDDELDVVIEEADKTDTNMPIFKVRVVNKGYAGQEMWIAATVLKRSGHVIEYSK
ncbi:MAG: hypothetical protein P4L53_20355 [Candidatus Obscuribacterales bacterium]|nr:hypothetical protein [Candidatus Obscuribacterales bacterium]